MPDLTNATKQPGRDPVLTAAEQVAQDLRDEIDAKWRSLGGAPGAPKVPGVRGYIFGPHGTMFKEYTDGQIHNTGAGVFWVHGAICQRYLGLGGPTSWLGLPKSDELALPEDGRVSVFAKGSIYWWPDTRAIDVGDVVVHYTGLHCFGETDAKLAGNLALVNDFDSPYATIGVVGTDGAQSTFSTKVYRKVNSGNSMPDLIEIYRGPPHGLVINSLLQDHGGGDITLSRSVMEQAVSKGSVAIGAAVTSIPTVGPVLGPITEFALAHFHDDILGALNDFVEQSLGFADRPLGTDTTTLSIKQMVTLATLPEGNFTLGPIGFRFQSSLLSRFGASYKLCFGTIPVPA